MSKGVGLSETDRAEGVDIDFEQIAVAASSGGLYMTGFDVLKDEATVFKSTNGGATWKRVARMRAKHGDPPTPLEFSPLAVDPSGRVYAGTNGAGRTAATAASRSSRRLRRGRFRSTPAWTPPRDWSIAGFAGSRSARRARASLSPRPGTRGCSGALTAAAPGLRSRGRSGARTCSRSSSHARAPRGCTPSCRRRSSRTAT